QGEALLRLLTAQEVQYILVGSPAMAAQGSAHITENLDICYCRSQENIAALAAALAKVHSYLRGAPPGLPFSFDVPTIKAGLNFTLITELGDVSLHGEVSGIGKYEQGLAQSEEKTLFGLKVHVLS